MSPGTPSAKPTEVLPEFGRHISFPAIHDVLERHGHGVLARHPLSGTGEPVERMLTVPGFHDPLGMSSHGNDRAMLNPVYESLHQEARRLWQQHAKANPEAGAEEFAKLAATVAAHHFPRHAQTGDVFNRLIDNSQMNRERSFGWFPELAEHNRQQEGAISPERSEFFGGQAKHPAAAAILDEAAKQPTDEGYAKYLGLAGEYLQEQGHDIGQKLLERAWKFNPARTKHALPMATFARLWPLMFAGGVPLHEPFTGIPAVDPKRVAVLDPAETSQQVDWRTHQPKVRGQGLPLPQVMTQGLKRPVRPQVMDWRRSRPPKRVPLAQLAGQAGQQGDLPVQAEPGEVPQSSVAFPKGRPKRALSIAGKFGQRAKQEGIPPKDLHDLAAMLRGHHEEHRGVVIEAINRAKEMSRNMGWGDLQTLAARAAGGKLDASMLPGFDEVAREFEQRYPDLVQGGNAEETLFNLLVAGHPPELSHAESYEQALKHLLEQKHGRQTQKRQREPGEEEEIPFARRFPLLFDSGVKGHGQDPAEPRVHIDERLLEQIRTLFPQSWFDWQRACLALCGQYGIPTQLPHRIGMIRTHSGMVGVSLVDGDRIMLEHEMDFNQGGNGYEDEGLCGKGEIVLDANILFPRVGDLIPICYHEACEGPGDKDGICMATGLTYDEAHIRANAKEKLIRKRRPPRT